MSELPEGWVSSPIGKVTTDAQQCKPKDDFIYIDISSINRETKIIENPQTLTGANAPSRARKIVKTGDVLVSMTRPNLNAVALVPPELDNQIASTGLDVLRSTGIDPRWLFYLVRSNNFVSAMSDLVQGALYPAVRSKDIRDFEIPLAPLAEQKRIADKLDALLAQVDGCRARLDRVPVILKRFRQAVLAAATSGTLTADWREENGGDEPWRVMSLGSMLLDIRYGTAKKSMYDLENGTPVLRIPNIGERRIDPTDLKFGHFEAREIEALSLQKGDLLVIRSNGSVEFVGKTVVVEQEFAGYLIRMRVNGAVGNPHYLQLFLSSPSVRNYIELTARSTSGVNNINSEELRAIQLNLPTLEEQHEIVRRVETLFGYADRLEARYGAAAARLTPALLAQAFRGELVAQDPADEPAGVLLARLRGMREGATPGADRRRKAATDATG